jgi:hypothetical protein
MDWKDFAKGLEGDLDKEIELVHSKILEFRNEQVDKFNKSENKNDYIVSTFGLLGTMKIYVEILGPQGLDLTDFIGILNEHQKSKIEKENK